MELSVVEGRNQESVFEVETAYRSTTRFESIYTH
jgi:hypothetical protein